MDRSKINKELVYTTVRSSGAGGQHVNKTETKVELRFYVEKSEALDDSQKKLVFEKLGTRINQEGILIMSNQETRSQQKNKKLVTIAFYELIEKALTPPKRRKKVVPLVSLPEKRLKSKKETSEKKKLRGKVASPTDNNE